MPMSTRLNSVRLDLGLPIKDPEMIEKRLEYLREKSETLDMKIMVAAVTLTNLQEQAIAVGDGVVDPAVLAGICSHQADMYDMERQAFDVSQEIENLLQRQGELEERLVDTLDEQFDVCQCND